MGCWIISKSAGDPAAMIVTLNYNPKYIDYKVSKNSKAYKINQSTLVKNRIRTIINRKILRTRWTNFIHSADDEIEAFNYLDAVSEKQNIEKLIYEKVSKNNKITLSRLSKTLKNTHVVSYPKTGSTLIRFFFDGIYEQLNAYIPFKRLEQFNPYLHKKDFQGWEKFHINSPYRVRYLFKNPLFHYIKYHHLDIYNIGSKIKENDIIIF